MLEAIREFLEASRGARREMVEYEEALVRGVAALEGGMSVMDALRSTPAREERRATQEAMNRLATARHRFRLLLIAACVEDGMNAREVSELWGFSRQRAQLLIQEARASATSDGGHRTAPPD